MFEGQSTFDLDGALRVERCSAELLAEFQCGEQALLGRDADSVVEGCGFSMRLRAGEQFDEIVSLALEGEHRLARLRVTAIDGWYRCRCEAVTDRDLLYRMVSIEHRWASVLRDTDDGIGILRPDGFILEHNASFVRLLALPMPRGIPAQANALIGRSLLEKLGDTQPELAAYLANPTTELVVRGDRLEIKAHPIALPNGVRVAFFVLVRDITEELQLRERERVTRAELEHARSFQQMILSSPPDIAPYRLEILYQPLDRVGGDLYDVTSMPAGSVRFFIADATGHGVSAALVTMLVRSAYESVKYTLGGPAAVMEALNDRIATSYRSKDVIFTALILDLALDNGYLEYCNGGHPPPILVDGNGARQLESGGTVVGARGYRTYPSWNMRIAPETSIYLLTDGLPEARRGMETFGDARVEQALVEANRAPVVGDVVIGALDRWLGGAPHDDDITLIAIRRA